MKIEQLRNVPLSAEMVSFRDWLKSDSVMARFGEERDLAVITEMACIHGLSDFLSLSSEWTDLINAGFAQDGPPVTEEEKAGIEATLGVYMDVESEITEIGMTAAKEITMVNDVIDGYR